ncbi:MAG TPA: hypothetical protein VF814_19390 [Casimicrobiaceae bacterium]
MKTGWPRGSSCWRRRIVGQRVYIYLIVDGRRDVQTLLARRLLET